MQTSIHIHDQEQQQGLLGSPASAPSQLLRGPDASRPTKGKFSSWVIDPSGWVYHHWSMVVSFAFLYNFWSLSYRFAFREIDSDTMAVWFTLDYSADLIYFLDVVINFHTGYLEDGVLQRNIHKIGQHYRECTRFYLDCFCLLPLDILYISIGLNSILRITRLVKIYKFWSCVDRTERHTNYPNVFRTFTLVHYILVIFHWNACIFHMISKNNLIDIKNLYKIDNNKCDDILCQYLHAFYWSILALTTIGDLPRPRTKSEYLYVIVELLFGLFVFASVLGHVANIVTNVSAARKEFQARLDSVKTFMRMRRVSEELQSKVIRWFDYLWTSQKSSDDDRSVACLPDRLKAEIAIHVHLDTLKRVDIFQNTEAGFLCELVLRLKPVLFSPGDFVCRKNEVGLEMYIISRGILEVLADDQSVVATLKAGSYFGEISVLNVGLAGNKRTASVRSVGYSDLFCLNKQDLWDVLKNHPNAEARIRARAEERLLKLDMKKEPATRPNSASSSRPIISKLVAGQQLTSGAPMQMPMVPSVKEPSGLTSGLNTHAHGGSHRRRVASSASRYATGSERTLRAPRETLGCEPDWCSACIRHSDIDMNMHMADDGDLDMDDLEDMDDIECECCASATPLRATTSFRRHKPNSNNNNSNNANSGNNNDDSSPDHEAHHHEQGQSRTGSRRLHRRHSRAHQLASMGVDGVDGQRNSSSSHHSGLRPAVATGQNQLQSGPNIISSKHQHHGHRGHRQHQQQQQRKGSCSSSRKSSPECRQRAPESKANLPKTRNSHSPSTGDDIQSWAPQSSGLLASQCSSDQALPANRSCMALDLSPVNCSACKAPVLARGAQHHHRRHHDGSRNHHHPHERHHHQGAAQGRKSRPRYEPDYQDYYHQDQATGAQLLVPETASCLNVVVVGAAEQDRGAAAARFPPGANIQNPNFTSANNTLMPTMLQVPCMATPTGSTSLSGASIGANYQLLGPLQLHPQSHHIQLQSVSMSQLNPVPTSPIASNSCSIQPLPTSGAGLASMQTIVHSNSTDPARISGCCDQKVDDSEQGHLLGDAGESSQVVNSQLASSFWAPHKNSSQCIMSSLEATAVAVAGDHDTFRGNTTQEGKLQFEQPSQTTRSSNDSTSQEWPSRLTNSEKDEPKSDESTLGKQ